MLLKWTMFLNLSMFLSYCFLPFYIPLIRFAYVEFENPDEADKAMKHMDGGQIDGQEVSCAPILTQIPKKSRVLSGKIDND